MIRNAIRATSVLFATLAVPAGILAASSPASAAPSKLCETNGHHYCVGSASLSHFARVTERKPGRNIVVIPQSGGVVLKFTAASNSCVAATNNKRFVTIKGCSGSLGIIWTQITTSNGHLRYINRRAGLYLAGRNNGTRYVLVPASSGAFKSFDFHS